MTCLYVQNLHPGVTEEMLYEKFSSAGPLSSLKMCRDSVTQQFLGNAFVNFHNSADARRALQTMNFDMLKGRSILIQLSRTEILGRPGIGVVFVKDLDRKIDGKDLYDTFSVFGNILSSEVVVDKCGISKGYGFIRFETEESAKKAINMANGKLLNGKTVHVEESISHSECGEARIFTSVYVRNLRKDTTEEELREIFAKFGNIISCRVMRNEDQSSRCFGFVHFDNPRSAEAAIKEMHNNNFKGTRLYVARAQTKFERSNEVERQFEQIRRKTCQGLTLMIKNLDDSIDDDRLRREFESFGTITSVHVTMENGRSRGIGFVSYASPEEARKAIKEMNLRIVKGRPLRVFLSQLVEDQEAYQNNVPHALPNEPYLMPTIAHEPPTAIRRDTTHCEIPHLVMPGSSVQNINIGNFDIACSITEQQAATVVHSRKNSEQTAGTNYGIPHLVMPGRSIHDTNIGNFDIACPSTGQQATTMVHSRTISEQTAATAAPQDEKQIIGERLFTYVRKMYPELAANITDMLLGIDNSELERMMIDDQESLKAKVEEAIAILRARSAAKDNLVRE